jgi:hypothetical protein
MRRSVPAPCRALIAWWAVPQIIFLSLDFSYSFMRRPR